MLLDSVLVLKVADGDEEFSEDVDVPEGLEDGVEEAIVRAGAVDEAEHWVGDFVFVFLGEIVRFDAEFIIT